MWQTSGSVNVHVALCGLLMLISQIAGETEWGSCVYVLQLAPKMRSTNALVASMTGRAEVTLFAEPCLGSSGFPVPSGIQGLRHRAEPLCSVLWDAAVNAVYPVSMWSYMGCNCHHWHCRLKVTHFAIAGRVAVGLHLFSRTPGIRGVDFSFLEPPTLDVQVRLQL